MPDVIRAIGAHVDIVLLDMAAVPPTTTVLRETPLVRALHSAIRSKDSSRRTFVTSADRLVQMLLEEALGLLPVTPVTIAGIAAPVIDNAAARVPRGGRGISLLAGAGTGAGARGRAVGSQRRAHPPELHQQRYNPSAP